MAGVIAVMVKSFGENDVCGMGEDNLPAVGQVCSKD